MRLRPENWPDLLAEHLAEWNKRTFAWGINDCGHFASSWMERLGYDNPLAGLPSWTSPISALRMLRKIGGMQHTVQAQMRAIGCVELERPAGRGNVALASVGGRDALGILTVGKVALLTNRGVSEYPLHPYVRRAWRV